jgi:hypothetical protein
LVVDVRHPNLHLLRKPRAAGQIIGEHRSCETVLCPIRNGERIILATGADDGRDRSEDLLACELHVVRHTTEDVWRQQPSVRMAAKQFSRVGTACVIDARQKALEL